MTLVTAALTKTAKYVGRAIPVKVSPMSSPAESPANESSKETITSPDLRRYVGPGTVNAFKPKPFPKLQLNLDAPKAVISTSQHMLPPSKGF
jgi:hypothetical protein